MTQARRPWPSPGPPSSSPDWRTRSGWPCIQSTAASCLPGRGGTARERLDAIRLLYDLNVGMVVRLALDSRSASGMPCKRASEVFRTYDAEFLDMLEHCGVDLFGLGALLTREEDAE